MRPVDVHHSKIYLAPSKIPGAGYGVFSKKHLKKGELLEIAPFVEVAPGAIFSQPNRLQDYAFRSHLNQKMAIVILGYGSMYNHHARPNVKYAPFPEDPTRLIGFYTLKDVQPNSELFVHYGRDPITKEKCYPILD